MMRLMCVVTVVFIVSALSAAQSTKGLRTEATEHFQVSFDRNSSAKHRDIIEKELERSYKLFHGRLGFAPGRKIPVLLSSTKERMRGDLRYGIFDDAYVADGKIVLILGPLLERQAAMAANVDRVVANIFARSFPTCPPWIAEMYGLAVGEDFGHFGVPTRTTLSSFSDLGEDLSRTSSESEIRTVYASLSATARFFTEQYGQSKLDALIIALRKGGPTEDALAEATGTKLSDLERAWADYLRGLVRR